MLARGGGRGRLPMSAPGARRRTAATRLLKSIARGGYAEVFRAEHRDRPGQFVAFKRRCSNVPLARERMAREIEVQRRFTHSHIMPILDADEDRLWFVMPIARGNLEDHLDSGVLGDARELLATEILDAVTQGLEPAHELGDVHRDISPRNILDLPGSADPSRHRWVVADWGIVKRPAGATTNRYTRTGEGLGTEGFAAPETWNNAHHAGLEADVYSIGRVVAWLLTGKLPAPNMPLLPAGRMRGLVAECTEINPARRIPTVGALRERLGELQATPELSPRATVADLVQQAKDGEAADVARIFAAPGRSRRNRGGPCNRVLQGRQAMEPLPPDGQDRPLAEVTARTGRDRDRTRDAPGRDRRLLRPADRPRPGRAGPWPPSSGCRVPVPRAVLMQAQLLPLDTDPGPAASFCAGESGCRQVQHRRCAGGEADRVAPVPVRRPADGPGDDDPPGCSPARFG